MSKLRACWAVQSPVGFAVQGDTQIRRVPMWMKTRKYKSTIPLIVHLRLQALVALPHGVGVPLEEL